MGELIDVPLADIKVPERILGSNTNDTALRANLKKEGLKRPLLCTSDLTLIDGQRRLKALRELTMHLPYDEGEKATAAVYVTDNFSELVARLPKVGDAEDFAIPLTSRPLDLFNLYELLVPIGLKRLYVQRSEWQTGQSRHSRRPVGYNPDHSFRVEFEKHVGTTKSILDSSRWLVELHQSPPAGHEKYVAEIVALVKVGKLTASGARYRMERNILMVGPVIKAAEQRQLIDNVMGSLHNGLTAFKALGEPSNEITKKELANWEREVRTARRQLQGIINRIGKRRAERE